MEIERDLEKNEGKIALVADDFAHIRKAIASAFLSDGFKTCVEVENGREAVEAAQKITPDIIILDLSMPIMNGLEATFELRKLFKKTPIILFTMYGDTFTSEARNAGVNLVLAKGTPLGTLIEKAHELIGS